MDHVRVVFRWLRDMLRGAWGVVRSIAAVQRGRLPGAPPTSLEIAQAWQQDAVERHRDVARILETVAERHDRGRTPAVLLGVGAERRLYVVKDSSLGRSLCRTALHKGEYHVSTLNSWPYQSTDFLRIRESNVIERLLPLIDEYHRTVTQQIAALRNWSVENIE